MSTDKRIQEAIEAGQKNQQTMVLVRNWCAHIKIKRFGGVGLVERQTGLPIGHHSLECPHAPASGMATWDLADAAVDFYNRNCAGCTHRKPVNLPNILKLVTERNAAREAREKEQQKYNDELAARLSARDTARDEIRATLTPIQATVLDQIEELDHDPTEQRVAGLVETAKIAPEHFNEPVRQHLRDLLEIGGYRRTEGCLGALKTLGDPAPQLCNASLKALARHDSTDEAAALVLQHAAAADEALIAKALPALIHLAHPKSYPMMGGNQRVIDKRPLQELYRHHPKAVEEGIQRLLDTNSARLVEEGARGASVISEVDSKVGVKFAATLIPKLVRANHLLADLDDHDFEQTSVIRSAIAAAFKYHPDEVDKIIQGFVPGANDEGQAAIIQIYEEVLRGLRYGNGRSGREKETATKAHEIAFHRLIWAATSMEGFETLQQLQSALSRDLGDMAPFAAKEIDGLLGAAAVLDDKLNKKTSPLLTGIPDPRPQELIQMENWNYQGSIRNLQETFVRWAGQAARRQGESGINKVLSFYRQIPEDRENLRAAFVGNMHTMAKGSEALNLILPDFYQALVGSSQVLRSSAASTLEELDNWHPNNLPDLVYEAFVPLLSDPFVIVHKAAVRALRRSTLPGALNDKIREALTNLVMIYAQSKSEDRFLIECLELLCGRYTSKEFHPQFAAAIISLLKRTKPHEVSKDIRFWSVRLRQHVGFVDLLIHLLQDNEAGHYHADDLLAELVELPNSVIQKNLEAIERLGLTGLYLGGPRISKGHAGLIIEILSKAGAWDKATNVARAAHADIEDSQWNKPIKLEAELRLIACEYEQAIASGNSSALAGIAQRWRKAHKEREDDLATHKEQRDPLRGLLG